MHHLKLSCHPFLIICWWSNWTVSDFCRALLLLPLQKKNHNLLPFKSLYSHILIPCVTIHPLTTPPPTHTTGDIVMYPSTSFICHQILLIFFILHKSIVFIIGKFVGQWLTKEGSVIDELRHDNSLFKDSKLLFPRPFWLPCVAYVVSLLWHLCNGIYAMATSRQGQHS